MSIHKHLAIFTDFKDDPDEFLSSLFDTYEDIRSQQGDLIVKVSVNEDGDLRAQNQDGRFDCVLDGDYRANAVILMLLETKDVQGFFSAFMTANKQELVLNMDTFSLNPK